MINRKITKIIALTLSFAALCGCDGSNGLGATATQPSVAVTQAKTVPPASPPEAASNPSQQADSTVSATSGAKPESLEIAFKYERQSGTASNQFAVWIENMDGQLIKTLYATRFTATGGYKNRPDSIPVWVEKSGLASIPESEIDAISGATPTSGDLSYYWDFTDLGGNKVAPVQYKFFVEGTLRWKNQVLCSGIIDMNSPVTTEAEPEFSYKGSGSQPALTGSSAENGMIGTVTASFTQGSN